jgi:hypothetical protein
MQLTVFNGSPRGRKSNSKIVLEHFLRGFGATPGNSYEIYYLNRLIDMEKHVNVFAEAETVLLVHPLYTDAMPAMAKLFIEALEPLSGREGNPTVGFLIQSGFQEAAHSRPVERYWEKFSQRMGCAYLGTIVRGGMEPLHRAPKQYSKILESINEIGRTFGETGQFDTGKLHALAGPEKLPWLMRTIVQLVWRFMGNPYWDDWLKENEALEESFAKPYSV